MVKTACKDCLFAIYEDNIQRGCQFNRLDKFNKSYIDCVKDATESYLLDGFCNRCTHTKYRDRFTNPLLEIEQRTRAKVDIYFNIKAYDYEYLSRVCKHLNQLYFPPASIHFMNGLSVHHGQFVNTIQEALTLPYKVTTWNPEIEYSEILFGLIKNSKSDFFIVTDNHYLPRYTIKELDHIFNEEVKNIGVFEYKGFNVYSMAKSMYLYQTGEIDIYEQIEPLLKERNPELCLK